MPAHNVLFPWITVPVEDRLNCFTWTDYNNNNNINNIRYEFHLPKLYSRAIDDLLTHCIEVRSTIQEELFPHDNLLLARACFQVFPRTLSKSLKKEWRQLETETILTDDSIRAFDELVMKFIASYSSEYYRTDLVIQLQQHPVKPVGQSVLAFYRRLLELNTAIEFLPGNEQPLTDGQLKQAFYDGMPVRWKKQFMSSSSLGMNFSTMTRNQIVRYFQCQEILANQKHRHDKARSLRWGKRIVVVVLLVIWGIDIFILYTGVSMFFF